MQRPLEAKNLVRCVIANPDINVLYSHKELCDCRNPRMFVAVPIASAIAIIFQNIPPLQTLPILMGSFLLKNPEVVGDQGALGLKFYTIVSVRMATPIIRKVVTTHSLTVFRQPKPAFNGFNQLVITHWLITTVKGPHFQNFARSIHVSVPCDHDDHCFG